MNLSILNPADTVETQNRKLLSIAEALMNRVERATDQSGDSFAHFQRTIALEEQVRARTRDLQDALEHLNRANAELGATKAEAEAARTHLSNALEAVHEGFALFDAEGRMVMRNSRFCVYLPDVTRQIQPPMHYRDYVATVSKSGHLALEDEHARREFHDRRMAAHDRRHVNFTVELTRDRWVQVSEQQTPDGGTAILQTEITDMVRLERQERDKLLDTQAVMIRATLDHLNQGVAIFDAQHRLVGSNRRLGSILNPPMQILRAGTSFETIADYFEQLGFFGEQSDIVALGKWVSSTPRDPLNFRASSVAGQVFDIFCQEMPDRGFVVSLTDITAETEAQTALKQLNETLEQRVLARTEELKRARDTAERANDSRTRFVAAVSHDLLQPLNAAKLFLAGVNDAAVPDPENAKIQRARNALGSVETILGALLDITRLDAGEPGIDRGDLPLAPVLRTLAVEYREIAQTKGVSLTVEPLDVTIDSDQTYFRRILQNLISNAVRYTHEGEVRVSARAKGDDVVLEVADTGCGIPASRLAEAFREFTRIHSHTDADPGMGLGLAIVDRACRLLGHSLDVVSTVGEGTTFILRVPLARDSQERSPGLERKSRQAMPLRGLVALIIENDAETSAALAQLVEGWHMHTLEAANQAAAAEMLSEIELTPDIILSDFHLGEGPDGLETVDFVRQHFGDIPAVLVTANRSREVSANAAGRGLTVVYKPLNPEELRLTLEQAISDPGASTNRG